MLIHSALPSSSLLHPLGQRMTSCVLLFTSSHLIRACRYRTLHFSSPLSLKLSHIHSPWPQALTPSTPLIVEVLLLLSFVEGKEVWHSLLPSPFGHELFVWFGCWSCITRFENVEYYSSLWFCISWFCSIYAILCHDVLRSRPLLARGNQSHDIVWGHAHFFLSPIFFVVVPRIDDVGLSSMITFEYVYTCLLGFELLINGMWRFNASRWHTFCMS